MSTIDITKSFCHIKKVLDILKSQNTKCNRRLVQSSRHSDAFVYISDGACTYTFSDGREQLAQRGDILYLSHKASYTMYIHDTNFKFIFCNFEFDTDIQRDCFIVTAPNPSHAENIFLKLWNTYKANKPYSEADILSMLYSIYAIVTRTKNADLIQKPQTNRITELKEYIDVNYSDLNLSVASLAEKYGELAKDPGKDTVFISHGDCMKDVEELKTILKNKYGADVKLVTDVGPVIGAHSGPGTLALFFVGRER